jgi:hypothetical protein
MCPRGSAGHRHPLSAEQSKPRSRSGGPHGKGVGQWLRKPAGPARGPITGQESEVPRKGGER